MGVFVFRAVIYFGSRIFMKKGLSPIALILISAVVGVVAYGVKQ